MIPVVADADTLFGATTRGLLIHLDYRGLIRLHWSALIPDEMSRALVNTGRKPDRAAATKHEAVMRAGAAAGRGADQGRASTIRSARPGDAIRQSIHVAACALVLQARQCYPNTPVVSLVTKNVRDFGVRKLATQGIDVERPDVFLLKLITENETGVAGAFAALRSTLRSAPTPEQLLKKLAADGQTETANALLALRQEGKAAL